MRLVNTSTLKLQEFFDSKIPEYVILSHTWGANEISFQAFQNGELNDKIKNCCKQAQKDGFQYAWIDTCCIDKTSSAELSEAINSMYRWYQHSSVCYTFLEDYMEPFPKHDWWERGETDIRQLRSCRWFTRGWTLQEIIAPSCVNFYDGHWTFLGTRVTLQGAIFAITGIPIPVLNATKTLQEYNIAVRMSWASKRKTTRLEDEAYCLMGLFDVNMPMLYGEGRRAFQRLQEEILKRYDDYSLFAWVRKETRQKPWGESYWKTASFLAATPSDFDEDNLKGFRYEELENLTGREFGNLNNTIVPPVPRVTSRGLLVRLPLHEGRVPVCSLKREPLKLFCLSVKQIDSASHTYIRVLNGDRQNIVPHDPDQRVAYPVASHDLSKFVYTDLNLTISHVPPSSVSTDFALEVSKPPEDRARKYSLDLMKVWAGSLVYDIRAGATYESPEDKVLLFQYADHYADVTTGAIVVGLRNGTPWCNILRRLSRADFYCISQGRNYLRLIDTLKKSTDTAGNPSRTRDLCSMQIGTGNVDAYLVTRVIKLGGGSDAHGPHLVLEIAVDFSKTRSEYLEVGVLECNFQLYRDVSRIRDIKEDDIVIESGEEPSYWRMQKATALVKPTR